MAKKTDAPAAKPGTCARGGRQRQRRFGPRADAAAANSGGRAGRLSALRQMCSLDCRYILLCSVFSLLCARCVLLLLVLLRSAPLLPSAWTAAAVIRWRSIPSGLRSDWIAMAAADGVRCRSMVRLHGCCCCCDAAIGAARTDSSPLRCDSSCCCPNLHRSAALLRSALALSLRMRTYSSE